MKPAKLILNLLWMIMIALGVINFNSYPFGAIMILGGGLICMIIPERFGETSQNRRTAQKDDKTNQKEEQNV